LLTTKGWDLAIGIGIAFYFLYKKQIIGSLLSRKAVDDLSIWLGLSLISYAVFVFDKNTPFPSIYALVPIIGTALIIIFLSKDTSIGKLLGSNIPVGIRIIRYSAYLWHQPLFIFSRHGSFQEPKSLVIICISYSIFVVSVF